MHNTTYRLYKQAGIGSTITGGIGGTGLGYLAGYNTSNFFKLKPKSWQDRALRLGGSGLGLLAGSYLGNKLFDDSNYDEYSHSLGERIAPFAKGALGLGMVAGVPYLGYKFINNLIKSKKSPKEKYDGDRFKAQKNKWDSMVAETLIRGDPNELAAIKKNKDKQFALYDKYSTYTDDMHKNLVWPAFMIYDDITNRKAYRGSPRIPYWSVWDELHDAADAAVARRKINEQLYPKYYE